MTVIILNPTEMYTLSGLIVWHVGFPHSSVGKASACNAGDLGSIPGSVSSPGEGNGNPSSIFAWRIPWTSLAGYSSWDHKSWTRLSTIFLKAV